MKRKILKTQKNKKITLFKNPTKSPRKSQTIHTSYYLHSLLTLTLACTHEPKLTPPSPTRSPDLITLLADARSSPATSPLLFPVVVGLNTSASPHPSPRLRLPVCKCTLPSTARRRLLSPSLSFPLPSYCRSSLFGSLVAAD